MANGMKIDGRVDDGMKIDGPMADGMKIDGWKQLHFLILIIVFYEIK